MAERAWMAMYWGDYLRDTMHLSTFQHGCYMLLIGAYWVRGGPLPDEPEYLARVCRTSCDKLARYGNPVLAMFTCKDGLLIHKRIEKELLRSSARSAAASAAAKQRARTSTATTIVPLPPTEDSKQNPPAEVSPLAGVAAPNGSAAHLDEGISKAKAKAVAESRGTRLPEDWEPGREGIEYAQELGLSAAQIREIYGAFMRHWLAKAGAQGRKLRWDLTWQTWVRNDCEKLREKAERERRWAEQRRQH